MTGRHSSDPPGWAEAAPVPGRKGRPGPVPCMQNAHDRVEGSGLVPRTDTAGGERREELGGAVSERGAASRSGGTASAART